LRLLTKLGYRADVTENGLEALRALEREPYDVVLMDVQMPTMDGLEATRRLHQRWPAGRRPHVIAATANAMQEERAACLAAGMDDYLSKPIRMEELAAALARVGAHVAARPTALATVIQSAAIERLRETIGDDDPDLLPALIDTFLTDAPRLIDGARRGLQQGQADEVRRTAHTLKSHGITFGAMSFSELSRELESAATSGTLEGAADLIARIEAEYERVRIALETVRDRGRP
jgi:CheY-like chemotaxis protein